MVYRWLLGFSMALSIVLSASGCGRDVRTDNQGGGTNTNSVVLTPQKVKAGFALDDTILYSSPAVLKAMSLGLERDSRAFWEFVNMSDEQYSVPKKKVLGLIRGYISNGDLVYIITSRPDYKKETLVNFLSNLTGVPDTNIFFEYQGKGARMYGLNLDLFYSDADQDIKDALSSGVKPVRIKRNPNSISRSAYNPGSFYEEIIEGSEE